jgi:hypothetical protein
VAGGGYALPLTPVPLPVRVRLPETLN